MAIKFQFLYGKEVIQLPVNPSEITISQDGNNESAEVVKLGEITILRDKKLAKCSIESFLPKSNSGAPYILTSDNFQKPSYYIKFFERVRDDKKPVRLVITGTGVNMLVSIENFKHALIAQDDDTQFSLELKEYRPYGAKKLKVNTDTNTISSMSVTTPKREKNGFAIGDDVVVNGDYFYSSYGAQPHGTFNNFSGKISIIVPTTSRKYRYHITTPSGGARGWVKESQLKHK